MPFPVSVAYLPWVQHAAPPRGPQCQPPHLRANTLWCAPPVPIIRPSHLLRKVYGGSQASEGRAYLLIRVFNMHLGVQCISNPCFRIAPLGGSLPRDVHRGPPTDPGFSWAEHPHANHQPLGGMAAYNIIPPIISGLGHRDFLGRGVTIALPFVSTAGLRQSAQEFQYTSLIPLL